MQSRRLATFVGPLLMAIAASEGLHFEIWANVSPTTVYLDGVLLSAGGLGLVVVHNRWRRDWSVLLTLSGWGALLAGFYRMFAPEGPQAPAGVTTYGLLAALFAVGGFLAFKAARP